MQLNEFGNCSIMQSVKSSLNTWISLNASKCNHSYCSAYNTCKVWHDDMKDSRSWVYMSYCWWTKSCTTKDDDYPIIYRLLTIPGGAGFCPPTVSPVCNHVCNKSATSISVTTLVSSPTFDMASIVQYGCVTIREPLAKFGDPSFRDQLT